MCGKAYRRIFDAEHLLPEKSIRRLTVLDFTFTTTSRQLTAKRPGCGRPQLPLLRQLLSVHNSWVDSHQSAVDEIARRNPDIHDAQICFGPVSRTTHGPILGDLPTTPEIAACVFQEDTTQLFRQVYTFPA